MTLCSSPNDILHSPSDMVLASSADVLADDESEDSDDSGDVRHDFISAEILLTPLLLLLMTLLDFITHPLPLLITLLDSLTILPSFKNILFKLHHFLTISINH